jgi:hypothetical protein
MLDKYGKFSLFREVDSKKVDLKIVTDGVKGTIE